MKFVGTTEPIKREKNDWYDSLETVIQLGSRAELGEAFRELRTCGKHTPYWAVLTPTALLQTEPPRHTKTPEGVCNRQLLSLGVTSCKSKGLQRKASRGDGIQGDAELNTNQ